MTDQLDRRAQRRTGPSFAASTAALGRPPVPTEAPTSTAMGEPPPAVTPDSTATVQPVYREATPSRLAQPTNGQPLFLTPRSAGWSRRRNPDATGWRPSAIPSPRAAYQNCVDVAERYAMIALRVGLGIVYAWFGVLKVVDATPVAQLVRNSLPFMTGPAWMVPALGVVEVIIGVWLITGWKPAALLPVFVAHMLGTFIVLVTEPGLTYQHGNPFLLTSTGEFVVKNLILLPAGIAICTIAARRSRASGETSTSAT